MCEGFVGGHAASLLGKLCGSSAPQRATRLSVRSGSSRTSRVAAAPVHRAPGSHFLLMMKRTATTPCFPLGGIFLQAVSGFSLVRKCLCFSPHCFSLMDWRARDRLWRSKGHRMALLCLTLSHTLSLSLAVLTTAGPSLTVPQEEMQIYS